jgi:hypothetical protein
MKKKGAGQTKGKQRKVKTSMSRCERRMKVEQEGNVDERMPMRENELLRNDLKDTYIWNQIL